ncbi:MAG: EAL domain-containing protein [Firmicutes bacterium]|nr:EAL domain-containing protein [Bacillota bacterium]
MARKRYSIKNRLALLSFASYLITGLVLVCFIIRLFTDFPREETFMILLFAGFFLLFGVAQAGFWHNRAMVKPITIISKALRGFNEERWTIPSNFSTGKKPHEISELSVSLKKLVRIIRGYRDRVARIAFYDDLTGLPNRACLFEKYKAGLNLRHHGGESVLLYLDTDDLKLVNDVYSHHTGDELLKSISCRIKALAEPWGFDVFRLVGDKFVLFNNNCAGPREVVELAQRILSDFEDPFLIGGNIFRVSLSIGIAINGELGMDLAQMLKNAEIAMYQVKEKGKNGFLFFDPSMDRNLKYRVELEQEIHHALLNQEFQLHYQPKVETQTQNYEGFEALLRWKHPKKGWISPDLFIGLAEKNGLIVPIGEWVLQAACRFLKELNERLDASYHVSVNVSVLQLIRDDFGAKLQQILSDTGLPPQYLELEVTESLLMESPEAVFSHLLELRDKGINIALDDFGKGYSSLTCLRQLPISTLKIDTSFVADIDDKDQAFLIGDIIRLGHHLGLRVVAEGVETKTQLEYLRKNHCDLIQGYYFSKPLPAAEILPLAEKELNSKKHLAI